MQGSKNNKLLKQAVFLVESQPPHLGEFVAFMLEIDNFDLVHVCLIGKESVMPIQHVQSIWQILARPFADKVMIHYSTNDFTELSVLPVELKDCVVLTQSAEIFVHMNTIGVPVKLLARLMGYSNIFQRVAYRQGRALDWLLNRRGMK